MLQRAFPLRILCAHLIVRRKREKVKTQKSDGHAATAYRLGPIQTMWLRRNGPIPTQFTNPILVIVFMLLQPLRE